MGTLRSKTKIMKIMSLQYQKLTVKSRKKLHSNVLQGLKTRKKLHTNVLQELMIRIRAHHLELKENSGSIRSR